jgi:NAD(P)-dependent dehydrogenase (short-subunit alcohol dehydrogenase family)
MKASNQPTTSKSKVWIITGAARGFGLEITKAVLAGGDTVVATVRGEPEKLQAEISHPNLHVAMLEVSNEARAQLVAADTVTRFGRIDVLVNNAGYGLLSAVEEATDEEVKRNYETNVFGLLNVTRAVLPHMRRQRSGHVINFSAVAGLRGYLGWGLYGSTKFAVEGITETMAQELAPLGIHASVVEPGFFRTNFLDRSSLSRASRVIDDYAETVGKMREFATQVNHKQPGDPVKLAKAIVRLAASPNPPMHLPLGNDTLAAYRAKQAAFEKEIDDWHDVITGTDHDGVAAAK